MTVKLERDIDGQLLIKCASPIEEMFSDLQRTNYQNELSAFDVEGFSVDKISVTGGQPVQLSFADKTVTVSWEYNLEGCDDLTNQL